MSSQSTIQTISFGSRKIDYELTYQDRKTLGIKVYPDCKVKVIAPVDTTNEKLQAKVKEKAPWILKQQSEFLSYHPLTPPRTYVNGETHLYLGRQYRLRLEPSKENTIKLYRGKLIVFQKGNVSAEKQLEKWYRQKADAHFKELLEASLTKFKKYKVQEPKLQIRYMPTRWGSCTPKGKVILNPELIKAPKGCIEYVIIHELCHLVYHNHTKDFYNLQEAIMPDWKKWKNRLERTLT
ncbi:MAG: M48 family metallopeptidase [Bacteroidia bacterium]